MTRRINGDALENRAGTAATGDVFVFDDAHADGGEWGAPGASAAFPVGSVFIAVVATNPATLLGYGTWAAFGAGRVLVGLDAGDTDFDTVEETGGAKTSAHTHDAGTLLPSAHPSHSHNTSTSTNMTISAHSGTAVDPHPNTSFPHYHLPGSLATSAHAGTAVDAHSGTAVSAHSGTAVGDHASHTHGYTDVINHIHPVNVGSANDTSTVTGAGNYFAGTTSTVATNTQNPTGGVSTGTTLGPSATLTHSVTQPANHTVTQPANHVVTQPSNHTMSGQTADRTATGLAVSHAVTDPSDHTIGGNTDGHVLAAHTMSGATASAAPSIVQPYIVCYFWKRTA